MASYEDISRWRFSLAMIYDRPVAATNRAMSTWDVQLTAWQMRRGMVEVTHAGGRLLAKAGDWVLIPPGMARRHRFSEDAAIRSIRCTVSDPAGQSPGLGLPPRIDADSDGRLQAAADRLSSVAISDHQRDLAPDEWAPLQEAVVGWCAILHARLGILGVQPPIEARVAAAQRLLLTTRTPAALPWDGLRSATGLSRPQLDRLFRQHCGRSVRAWAEGRLLADACAALGDLAEPVKAVAARLGFGDASHFCRWFRQRTGASPADWRRRGGT